MDSAIVLLNGKHESPKRGFRGHYPNCRSIVIALNEVAKAKLKSIPHRFRNSMQEVRSAVIYLLHDE